MNHLYNTTHEVDVCVVGGGMAGLCTGIAAARNGAKTIILQDRPMFGGNASSEVRMWICGAHGRNNKETGILEEIQLENLYRNPGKNYSLWDGILWEKARFQPNLDFQLNCSVTNAQCEGNDIVSVTAWQLTTQTWHTVVAKYFVDCSGDSILGAVTPAKWRWGRESRHEFGEDIQPEEADEKTMGHTLLIQQHRCKETQPFTAPKWAYKFESPEDFKFRLNGVNPHNFWWLELGGIQNTIRDTESIRDELIRCAYGVWDYIKNRAPERERAANWAIHWIGMYPGKRENRRFVGDYTLTQNDIENGGRFDDTVAFGGWTMDDHHPAGMLYPEAPTIHHPAPSPYGIPYRCLYSENIGNLFFAGRNISVTHAALSSTRVMATCAVIGQAVGTASALCTRYACAPRTLYKQHLQLLQETLQDDDCFLPGFRRSPWRAAHEAKLETPGEGSERLLNGIERDRDGSSNAWEGDLNTPIAYTWNTPISIGGIRLVFDSNLNNDKRMPCSYPVKTSGRALPVSLVCAFRIEVRNSSGRWETFYRDDENRRRLVEVPVNATTDGIRLIPETTWGSTKVRIFAFEPTESYLGKIPEIPDGHSFAEIRAAQDPNDLRPPSKGSCEITPAGNTA